jgi:CheY-like chemotaxis protein
MESEGFEILSAKNGSDGLSIFHRSVRPIDLLVTDCNMPGMTGMDLARACARRNSKVGVLYISDSSPDAELQTELEKPRRAFLASPFRGNDLLRKAREVLASGFERETVGAQRHLHLAVELIRSG